MKKGLLFKILIPVGVIVLVLIYDVFQGIYYNYKIKSDVEDTIKFAMTDLSLETFEQYNTEAKKVYESKGYNPDNITFKELGNDEYLITAYATYDKVTKQFIGFIADVSNNFTGNNEKYSKSTLVTVNYKAYYNEYKELVIEKYEEKIEDYIEEE